MAIKPNDCIVPYGKLVRWVSGPNGTSWRNIELQHDVAYLKNFDEHVSALSKQSREIEYLIRDRELAKFNATFKTHRTNSDNNYIKFGSHADLTFFILKWI